jgi:hypothetical protein
MELPGVVGPVESGQWDHGDCCLLIVGGDPQRRHRTTAATKSLCGAAENGGHGRAPQRQRPPSTCRLLEARLWTQTIR